MFLQRFTINRERNDGLPKSCINDVRYSEYKESLQYENLRFYSQALIFIPIIFVEFHMMPWALAVALVISLVVSNCAFGFREKYSLETEGVRIKSKGDHQAIIPYSEIDGFELGTSDDERTVIFLVGKSFRQPVWPQSVSSFIRDIEDRLFWKRVHLLREGLVIEIGTRGDLS